MTTVDIPIAEQRKKLTQEQVDAFMARGYLSLGKILEDDEIAFLKTEYDREFELAETGGAYRVLPNDGGTSKADGKRRRMLQIMHLGERNIHFRKLYYDDRILDIVEDLMGPNIQLFHDQALFKPAHHGGAVFWHQDNAYWQCTPANLISCWMTLDAADRENGAMQVIPGSHLNPVHHERSAESTALFDIEKHADLTKAVVVDLPAGGAMIHHCQTLHYTQPNSTDRDRRAFILHFMTPGTINRGNTQPIGFSKPLLRMRVP